MNCSVCQLDFEAERPQDKTCSPTCVALAVLTAIQAVAEAQDQETYPGMFESERRQLQWDIRKRWHEVRDLPFTETPPKSGPMKELERLDLLDEIEGYPRT